MKKGKRFWIVLAFVIAATYFIISIYHQQFNIGKWPVNTIAAGMLFSVVFSFLCYILGSDQD